MLKKGEITPSELFNDHVASINKNDKELNAFLAKYDYLDPSVAQGDLWGIPGIIKDNILIEGLRCTAGSRVLENYTATYDATVVSKLKRAGSTFLGKGNLDEFAMGSTGEYSAYGPTLNPHDVTRVAGGSSSGSVAAVASGMAMFGLGSETGGSIRVPASWCGVVGVKPTYGRVSRHGLIAMASSLDQIGTVTRTVRDGAIVLGTIAGHDLLDSTSSDKPVPDYAESLGMSVQGLKVAVINQFFNDGLDSQIADSVKDALAQLESQGAIIEYIDMPSIDYALASYYVIVPSEVSSNMARYDGIRYGLSERESPSLSNVYSLSRQKGLGPEVRRRIMIGTYALSSGYYDAYYIRAQRVRTIIRKDLENVFANHNVIIGPTTATLAPKLGELDNPLAFYLVDSYMTQVNLAGLPAITVPYGFGKADGTKLPIGVHIIAKHFDESTMFSVAHALEQVQHG